MNVGTFVHVVEVASFPPGYFLENFVVRKNGSLLVTALSHKELWYIPPERGELVEPVLLYTFDMMPMGIVETEPDVFYVATGQPGRARVYRVDLRDWTLELPVSPHVVLELESGVGMVNGACLAGPKTILVADCYAGKIWRIDLEDNGMSATAREWLRHDSMMHDPLGPMPDQPGVNGVRYAAKSHTLYYTNTAQTLFMRIAVDPHTLDPKGEPELVATGMMGDDFCIDEESGVALVTTHRENTLDRVALTPDGNPGPRDSVVGDPVIDLMIGPTSAAWSRKSSEHGRVAYVITDGGIKAPMPDGLRPAKVLRVTL
jgi:hypothetical protein